GERSLLPSFLYIPGQHDLPAGAVALPWDAIANYAVGEFARNHGAKVPGRLVSSAKSWLCHAGVDRTAPLLPWTAPPDVPRLSPLEVSMRLLKHIVQAWNSAPNRPEADQAKTAGGGFGDRGGRRPGGRRRLAAHADYAGRRAEGDPRRLLPDRPARGRARSIHARRLAGNGPAVRERPGRHSSPGRLP